MLKIRLVKYCKNNTEDGDCEAIDMGVFPVDTMLYATVDYSTWLYPISTTVNPVGKYTIIKLKINAILNVGDSVDINFRIYKKDWSAWNPNGDWTYQRTENVLEPNYFFTIYDIGNNLLWGSDPFTGKSNADVELWNDRNGNYAIIPYDGNTFEIQRAGRFWMIKNVPLNKKESLLLEKIGVSKLSASAKGEKSLILLKSKYNIRKKLIDSLVYGFYNSFSVDDSTKLNIQYDSNDWFDISRRCDSLSQCRMDSLKYDVISSKTHCWEDVLIEDCKNIVDSCGGTNVAIDNYIIVSNDTKDALN